MVEQVVSHEADEIDFDDPLSELDDRESSPPTYEIATYPADFTLEVLHSKWKNDDLQIPKFQRGFVWSQNQASKLIESFLVGLPVPAIFLYTERASERSLVVDGQQRLRTIFDFFEGNFGPERKGKRTVFRLTGLSEDSPYVNKTYADLVSGDEAASRRLRDSVLRAFVVRQLDPADDTSVFHIFERLNTGGTLLTNQEVRNAVCSGDLNDLLHTLNELPEWRSVLGKEAPDPRMRDVELILRFLSLLHARDKYQKPMKDFMSRYMRQHAHADPEHLVILDREFRETLEAVSGTLPEKPFHFMPGSTPLRSTLCSAPTRRTSPPSLMTLAPAISRSPGLKISKTWSAAGRLMSSRFGAEWRYPCKGPHSSPAGLGDGTNCHAEGRGFESHQPLLVMCCDIGDRCRGTS